MKKSLLEKLERFADKCQEIHGMLSDLEIINDKNRYCELSKEYASREALFKSYQTYQKVLSDLESVQAMLSDSDSEIKILAQDEIDALKQKKENLENDFRIMLLPKDPSDKKNIYLEIRAGTGGNEAALFSRDLFRMYSKFADNKNWKIRIISQQEGEKGGYKEIIARVVGKLVYSQLKFESGVHRVQRVPTTESQGRVHTSACTVAILPEVDELETIKINPSELRIDTFRASGAGGQHVNKTDSAIRITHLPSRIVVECQDERSQHKNKARALSLLQTKLKCEEEEKKNKERAAIRKSLVGSGDRSERIRTYNFPQGRITDHRINLTLYELDEVMEGSLDPIIVPLTRELQAEQLSDSETS